jgi:hypothetical protein
MKKQHFTMLLVLSTITAYSQINLLSNSIYFRNYNSANNSTTHYGDLYLDGGSNGTGWGWLSCNQITNYGLTYLTGNTTIWGSLAVYPTDSTKVIKYVAIEAGEALTLVRGTTKTENGQVSISLPEHFSLVTSDEAPITVLLTPKRVPALLYVKEESKERIVVGMKQSDFIEFRDVEFTYQVTGVRDGFEDEEIIVNISKINSQENISEKRAAYNEKVKKLELKMKNEKKNIKK